ncbi:hypothetical protein FGIG_01353 [Fasciola gigantica]|uniref:Transmembrane protein n=1 Tax=Fasciola gigantica TaxID=46835 RepID=A0A504Z7U8_FASGI|nr:hypothetical protein FGIG_01353 [Fasciola gigantica]
MYHHKLRQTHFGLGVRYTITGLSVAIIIAFLIGCISITGAWNLLPDPASFPGNLRAIYTDVSERFKCDFNQGHSCEFSLGRGWSFHQSIQEFANKVKEAAKQTTDEAQRKTNNSLAKTNSPSEMDYFLCSVAGSGSNSNGFTPLQVRIPWPRFIPFSIPLAVTEETKRSHTESNRLLTSKAKQGPNSGEIISQAVTVRHDSSPVACMQLSLRFPPEHAAQINLVFDFPLQMVKLEPESKASSAFMTNRAAPNKSARSVAVPRNVWIILTVPLFSFQATNDEVEVSVRQNQSFLFAGRGLTWMTVLKETVMSVRASADVCVDNFQIRPIAPLNGKNQTENTGTCFRGLTWQDPRTGMNRTVLLDPAGFDATVQLVDSVRSEWDERNQLEFVENSTVVVHLGWFRFTGALVLAVCATLLFLLFTITLCVSIALTRRRKSPSRMLLTSSRIIHSNSRNRVFRPPDYAEDSLLPRIQKSKPEEETQSSVTEPVSTENGESLFQHDGNTCRSLVPDDGETEAMDPMATSAIQLARNWFLYRNRGDRLRQRTHFGLPITTTTSMIPYPPASPLTATASSPSAPFKQPTDKVCIPPFKDNQTPAVAPATNYRHSLVLSVDDHDQLVILPSAQSITNSMHRSTALDANSSIYEIAENESDNNANCTSIERNTSPVMHIQSARLHTIDSSSLSDTSPHLERDN